MESNSLCFWIQCHSSRIGGGQKYAVKAGWPQGWQKKDINSWNCWVKRKLLCSIQKAVGRFAKHTKRIKEQHSVQGHVKSKEKSACYVIVQMDFSEKFSSSEADEVKRAYFKLTMVTLYPVVMFSVQCGCRWFC